MSSIAESTGGSDDDSNQELFYFKNGGGGEVLINFCNAPIQKNGSLSVMENVSDDIKGAIKEESMLVSTLGKTISGKTSAIEKYDHENKKIIGLSFRSEEDPSNPVQVDLICKKGSESLEVTKKEKSLDGYTTILTIEHKKGCPVYSVG